MEIDGITVPKDYKSPLQQRGDSQEDAAPRPIPTRHAFTEYLTENLQSTDGAIIYGRFIWSSEHVVRHNRRLIRIHLTDLFAPESAEILKARYEDKYDTHRYTVDKDQMTGTIWISDDATYEMPLRGQKLKIKRFTNPLLYRNECCQFTTRIEDLDFEKPTALSSQMTETGGIADEVTSTASVPAHATSDALTSDIVAEATTTDTSAVTTTAKNANPNATPTASSSNDIPMKVEPDLKKRKIN